MKKAIILLGALLVWSMSASGLAQTWPNRPVRLIVPFASGSDTDFLTRIVGTHLAGVFGQPFVVENRVGASGAIAGEFVAKSPPDGYTFFSATTGQIQVVPLVQKVNYDGYRDFVPVANIANSLFLLAVHPSIPARTLREFIEYAKANPGKLNYGSSGTGTISHLSAALLSRRAGLTMTHVPYKGSLPAVTDLVGGQIQVLFNVT
ncbi:MAG: tripartite tricarboxylate transporter substrate binding protein, partial [Betaproteobacteria bacterium]|nr:tripartite tricarboxylate transporter substrate binding protein [Betaproteobacteria bacterium]